jgi:3-methyladenine DNA glycosylase AlkD
MSVAWSDALVAAVVAEFEPLRGSVDAEAQSAYMKHVAPFLGIATPARRKAVKVALKSVGAPPNIEQLATAAQALWQLDEREYAYAACDVLNKHIAVAPASMLVDYVMPLVLSKSWWDTVDSLRADAVTPLVVTHPELKSVMRDWSRSDNRWLVRLSIIHQLGLGARSDLDLLFEVCERHATNTEFFVAKAIGWALRDLSWGQPDAVEHFIACHPQLTPLARREGSKRIEQSRARGGLKSRQ